MFKSVEEAFDWMVSFTNLEKKPDLSKRGYRLDKMFKLLDIIGNPHRGSYKVIHVAGSKGKGSTSSFIASILDSSGFKVGIYSSPHLLNYRERITSNHSFFPDETYIRCANRLLESIEIFNKLPEGEPTTFELMTLLAFMVFKEEMCDWVVLETGIGGRLDSTNVVDPEASVITTIELEHTDLLGDTLEKIAFEKAGIIKRGKPLFTSNSKESVLDVFRKRVHEEDSTISTISREFTVSTDSRGTVLNYLGEDFQIGLKGDIQGENAVLAIEAVKGVCPNIDNATIKSGLKKCRIPGRFQTVNDVVLDGAHTRESIKKACETFTKIYGSGTVIFGAVTGKDISSMVEVIAKSFDDIIVSTPGYFKESNIDDIYREFQKYKSVKLLPSPEEALKYARTNKKQILVTGSFYMAGEIGKLLNLQ